MSFPYPYGFLVIDVVVSSPFFLMTFFVPMVPFMTFIPVMSSTSSTPAIFVPPYPTSSNGYEQHHDYQCPHHDSLHHRPSFRAIKIIPDMPAYHRFTTGTRIIAVGCDWLIDLSYKSIVLKALGIGYVIVGR
jgi:hypothetical protein